MNKVLVAALLAAGCALAHAEPSAAKKALIDKVLQIQRPMVEAQARSLAERPASMIMQSAAALIQQRVPVEKREALFKDIQGDMVKYAGEVGPIMSARAVKLQPAITGAVLDTKFSEAELKQLIASLEAPAYRKYQESTEEMLRPLSEKLVQETRADIEPRLKALDQGVRKRLEAAVAAPAGPAAAPAPGPGPAPAPAKP